MNRGDREAVTFFLHKLSLLQVAVTISIIYMHQIKAFLL